MSAGSDQPVFSIGAVAKMLGMPAATLRAWEDRYETVIPHRSEGSQRLYSRAQVDQLRSILAAIERGMSTADAHRLLQIDLRTSPADVVDDPPQPKRSLVLLAERDPYAAELADFLLRTEGYEVLTAMDGGQALSIFAQRHPVLVVIDLLISGGAGFRLCREFSTVAEVPILAVSALDSANEALEAGASAFLQKPLEPLQLLSIVRDLLGTSALTGPGRRIEQPA